MPVVVTEPVTTALLAMLSGATEVPVGDHGPPLPTQAVPAPTSGRYSVLWQIPGGSIDGTLGDPHDSATLVYQLDSHGRSRQQCQWMADRNRTVMLSRTAAGLWVYAVPITGWVVSYREQQTVDAPVDEGRDETGVSLWSCRERFEITVVPA